MTLLWRSAVSTPHLARSRRWLSGRCASTSGTFRPGVDFDAERPHIDARIVCTIRIGQIVAVALIFGAGYLKQKLQAKKARAARAKTAPDTQERKVSNG